jgi:thiamine biosynthesis lipoprotein
MEDGRRPAQPLGVRLAVLGALAAAAACADSPAPTLVERRFAAMGSELRVGLWTADESKAAAAAERVAREFDRLEGLLSVCKDGSDVVRLNRAAGAQPVAVARETLEVLDAAREASEWTGGKFDITFGALADIWKFDHDQDNTVPERAAIDARLPLVDYTAIRVDRDAGTAFIAHRGMRIHLGGIGKGYAIDRAIAILKAAGFTDFVIQSGGDLYVAGSNGSQPWSLGIADPRRPDRVFARVQLANATFSTSGDYERAFMKNGVRYHHLLDPDRGEPARGCRSVTIVADRAILADVLSTGVFIMGPADGMALIEKLPGVEGVIVSAKNEVLISSGLRGRVEIAAPPIDAP